MSLLAALLFSASPAFAGGLLNFPMCPPPSTWNCLTLQDNDGAIHPDDWIAEALREWETPPGYLQVTVDTAAGALRTDVNGVPLDRSNLSWTLSYGSRMVYFVPVESWEKELWIHAVNVGEETAVFNVWVEMAAEPVR